jgi:hypothetical protein
MSGTFCQPDPIRCPYCVQDNEFRIMLDLSGGVGGMFYCAGCRHLVRMEVPDFQCLCRACMNLRGAVALVETGRVVPIADQAKREKSPERAMRPLSRSSAAR